MDLISQIEWVPMVVSFVLAFGLGWLWYSPVLFLKPWAGALGINTAEPQGSMAKPMVAQALGTLLLAVITNLAVADGHAVHAVVVALAIAFFIMASNFYKQNGCNVARIEAGYILAMVLVMIVVNIVL